MFNKFFHWLLDSKDEITSQETTTKHRDALIPVGTASEATVHCCCTLTPDQFAELIKSSRISAFVWYKAVWLVQHYPTLKGRKINVAELADQTGTTWPTAKIMLKRIEAMLPTVQYIEKIEKKTTKNI